MINDIPKNWQNALTRYIGEDKWERMVNNMEGFLQDEEDYHPQGKKIFAALKATPFNKVRVVIIGQDPYPEEANATGLAFSAPTRIPLENVKSVKKMYCSITTDLGGNMPAHGNLNHWARQNVLLLNRSLTLHRNNDRRNSEASRKWLFFTKAVVKALSDSGRPIHFMLWGSKVRNIKWSINQQTCHIYEAYHPAARVSADEDFLTYHNFLNLNNALGEDSINWFPPPEAPDND